MTEAIKSIILGIIQGLTEFLPVSSSGHLEIAKVILGDTSIAEQSMMMTIVLHAATALSTIVIFRKDILEIILGLFQKNREKINFSLAIIISMIPAGIIGVLFDDILESLFNHRIMLVGFMLLLTGFLLFISDKATKTNQPVNFKNAFIIGIAQMVAILPGISRSGATIATSVLLGIDREKAARFSFLMVVPLILGKIAKDIIGGDLSMGTIQAGNLGLGFIAAFITGIMACTWMISIVKRSKLSWFAYYCLAVGILAIAYKFFF